MLSQVEKQRELGGMTVVRILQGFGQELSSWIIFEDLHKLLAYRSLELEGLHASAPWRPLSAGVRVAEWRRAGAHEEPTCKVITRNRKEQCSRVSHTRRTHRGRADSEAAALPHRAGEWTLTQTMTESPPE